MGGAESLAHARSLGQIRFPDSRYLGSHTGSLPGSSQGHPARCLCVESISPHVIPGRTQNYHSCIREETEVGYIKIIRVRLCNCKSREEIIYTNII